MYDTPLNSPERWRAAFPFPQHDDYKYSRGHVLVIGGPKDMTGAARMAAKAALRTAAGMVTVACKDETLPIYATSLTSVMTCTYNRVSDLDDCVLPRKIRATLVGPGMGISEATRQMVLQLLSYPLPCILDADGISSFADNPKPLFDAIKKRDAATIMTPHEGEFIRLFDKGDSREEALIDATEKSQAIIVYKGPETLIASPNHRTIVKNTHASPVLATAGSGDVLAGMITALAGCTMDIFDAACAAVWLHGDCGQRFGLGMIADDLIDTLPQALTALEAA